IAWQPEDTSPPQFLNITNDPIDVRGMVAHGDTIWSQSTNDVRSYDAILGGPADDAPHPIEVVSDGNVWAGTVNGIRIYRPDGAIVQDLSTANSPLGSDEVRAIRS